MELDYPSWTGCGIGSSVTYETEFMEVTATLLERDPEKAVLRIVARAQRPQAKMPELTFTKTLKAQPLREDRPSSFFFSWDRRSSPKPGTPASFSLSQIKPSETVLAEGEEILEISGEDWITRWIEIPGKYLDLDVRLKFWRSESIPGLLAKLQIWTGPEDSCPLTWKVTSFERRS